MGAWWGMTISEARLYDFRQVTPHPNAAYYSIFRVRQTVENKATDVGRHFYAELSEEKIFLLFSINRLNFNKEASPSQCLFQPDSSKFLFDPLSHIQRQP
jgi:hypothetical protein